MGSVLLTKREILGKILTGERVKVQSWEDGRYVYLDHKYRIVDENGNLVNMNNLPTEGYVVLPHPVETVAKKLAPALVSQLVRNSASSNDHPDAIAEYYTTSKLYASEDEAKRDCMGFVRWPAHEYSPIEVQEVVPAKKEERKSPFSAPFKYSKRFSLIP